MALPFAGGTYFPPEPRFGLPGFGELLDQIHAVWTGQRADLLAAAGQMQSVLAADELEGLLAAGGDPGDDGVRDGTEAASGATADEGAAASPSFDARRTLAEGATALVSRLDLETGGEFGAPKFPPCLSLDFLLRQSQRTGAGVLPFVEAALVAMDRGGLHDQVGGGFHRYCLDEHWQIPHFEKLLPDNALLAGLYAEAYAITGQPRWAEVARSTLAWMTSALRSPEGLYFGSLDADSLPFGAGGRPVPGAHAEEGRYYLWTPGEIEAVLGEQQGAAFAALFGVTATGNFVDGRSIPRPVRARDELAQAPLPGRAHRRRVPALARRGLRPARGGASRAPAARARREVPGRLERPGGHGLRAGRRVARRRGAARASRTPRGGAAAARARRSRGPSALRGPQLG